MASHIGRDGIVKVGAATVAEVKSFSIEESADTTGQGALTVGASVTLALYPEGEAVGATFYSGTALVTGVSRTASFDGMVEASISVQGTGALTSDTAP